MSKKHFLPTAFALKNRISFMVIMVMIFIFGIISYQQLPKEDNPEIKYPYIFVSTVYSGVSAADIETLITKPLEKYLKTLPDLTQVVSSSSESFSSIFIEFNTGVDVDGALQKVRDKVNQAAPELPKDADDTNVDEFSLERFPIMILSLSGDFDLVTLKSYADVLQDKIDTVKGVLETELVGGLEPEIQILVDLFKLNHFELDFDDLVSPVQSENVNMPGGEVRIGASKYLLRVPGEFSSVDEIQNIIVDNEFDKPIYVRDLAEVKETYKDQESLSRYQQENSVSIIVRRRAGENLIDLSEEIHTIVDKSMTALPDGLNISIIGDRAENIRSLLNELINTIITGMLLVVVVLMFTLGGLNACFVGVAIPLSILMSFSILSLSGITLNMVVLFSLILALGMLVDNGIVIVENIYRHVEEGASPMQAALDGTSEVAMPVIVSTITTLAAFFPMIFWPGIMGEFMKYLPQTLMISLSASLFVAMFISPVLCATFMSLKKSDVTNKELAVKKGPSKAMRRYNAILRSLISEEHHRPALLRRSFLTVSIFMSVLFFIVMSYVGATQIEYALTLGIKDSIIQLMDAFGPAIILSVVGLSILSYIYLSSESQNENRTVIRGLFMFCAFIAFLFSFPFFDLAAGYFRFVSSLAVLAAIYFFIVSFKSFDSSFIKRHLSVHAFIILFFAAVSSLGGLDVLFFPNITPEQIAIQITMPQGTTIEKTDEIVSRVEAIVQEEIDRGAHNIRHFVTNVGVSGGDPFSVGASTTHRAEVSLEFYKKEDRQHIAKHARIPVSDLDPFKTVKRLREKIKTIPGGDIGVKEQEMGPPTGREISIEIAGDDIDTLRTTSKRIIDIVSEVEGAVNVSDSWVKGNPEIRLSIDREKAAIHGVSTYMIASTLRTAVNGRKVSAYRDKDDEVDIVILLDETQRHDLSILNYLTITGKDGERIPLSQVAQLSTHEGIGSISRVDFKRVILVEGDVSKESGRTANEIVAELKQRLDPSVFMLSPGYQLDFTGQQQEQKESEAFLSRAFLIALFLIGLILISQFNSLVLPFIILFSVFLSFIGVVLGLYLAPLLFSFTLEADPFIIIMTGVGIISLAGVVVNNAIVLIDYIQQLRDEGLERTEAIIQGGLTRFRPVILTAVTTILGLVPMSLGWSLNFVDRLWGIIPTIITGSSSSEWWAPLANAVIFGLAVATVLTLVMVPVFYYILDGAFVKVKKNFSQRQSKVLDDSSY